MMRLLDKVYSKLADQRGDSMVEALAAIKEVCPSN